MPHRRRPTKYRNDLLARTSLPNALVERDLRETFELPLMSGRQAEQDAAVQRPAIGDAASLFDDRGTPKRKTTAADARAKARRCSACGGFVPQGMSICMSCGLDQETGFASDSTTGKPVTSAGPPPSQGPPIHVAVVGGLCAAAGLILMLLAVTQSVRGSSDWRQYGWLFLALVSAYGIYTSVEFIRGRTAKLLMVALMLGIIVDLMALGCLAHR